MNNKYFFYFLFFFYTFKEVLSPFAFLFLQLFEVKAGSKIETRPSKFQVL